MTLSLHAERWQALLTEIRAAGITSQIPCDEAGNFDIPALVDLIALGISTIKKKGVKNE